MGEELGSGATATVCRQGVVTAIGIKPSRSGAARCVRKKDSKQFAAGVLAWWAHLQQR